MPLTKWTSYFSQLRDAVLSMLSTDKESLQIYMSTHCMHDLVWKIIEKKLLSFCAQNTQPWENTFGAMKFLIMGSNPLLKCKVVTNTVCFEWTCSYFISFQADKIYLLQFKSLAMATENVETGLCCWVACTVNDCLLIVMKTAGKGCALEGL